MTGQARPGGMGRTRFGGADRPRPQPAPASEIPARNRPHAPAAGVRWFAVIQASIRAQLS